MRNNSTNKTYSRLSCLPPQTETEVLCGHDRNFCFVEFFRRVTRHCVFVSQRVRFDTCSGLITRMSVLWEGRREGLDFCLSITSREILLALSQTLRVHSSHPAVLCCAVLCSAPLKLPCWAPSTCTSHQTAVTAHLCHNLTSHQRVALVYGSTAPHRRSSLLSRSHCHSLLVSLSASFCRRWLFHCCSVVVLLHLLANG